jgi:hypothetical protein
MMLEELDREIMALQEQLRRREKLRADLMAAEASLTRERARLAGLEGVLEREGADVQRLEGLSLTGLFHTVLGDKDDRLTKERQEYLAAKLKHDEGREAVRALESEVLQLRTELRQLDDQQLRYEELLAQKEEALVAMGGGEGRRLAEVSRQLADAQADDKELQEAIAAGDAVLAGLKEMAGSLASASGWGVWDMLGGGFLTTMAKHSNIDDAREAAYRVQQLLRRYQRELADVTVRSSDLDIDVGSFATFADYFFDGLIVDWVVQSRLARAHESVAGAERQVRTTIRQLDRRLTQVRQRAEALDAERRRLLAGG